MVFCAESTILFSSEFTQYNLSHYQDKTLILNCLHVPQCVSPGKRQDFHVPPCSSPVSKGLNKNISMKYGLHTGNHRMYIL